MIKQGQLKQDNTNIKSTVGNRDLKIRGRRVKTSSENVNEKVNSRSFNLHRDYAKSLALSNVGNYS